MTQTKEGGRKTAAINKANDPLYYVKIGAMGGRKGTGPEYRKGGAKAAGFAKNLELARTAGAKGGTISKRRPGVKRAKGEIPTLPVSRAEQDLLTELQTSLQAEAAVVSY